MSKGRIQNLNEDFWEFIQQRVAINIMKKLNKVKKTSIHRQGKVSTKWIVLLKNCWNV